jgi:tetratricopeptide (TPR) repeat protein
VRCSCRDTGWVAIRCLSRWLRRPAITRWSCSRISGRRDCDEASIFSERGWTLDALGRETQAEQAFIEAIKRDPGFWRVYTDLGGFYFNHVQYQRALELFREALDLAPGNSTVLHNIGAAQLSMGDFEDALHTYQSLRDQQDSLSRSMISNIGTTYYNLGCFEESATFQQQAVTLAPNDHTALGRLAESCRFIGDRSDSATQLWRRAIELAEASPNQASWSTRGLLAVYQAHVGEFDEATRQIEAMWSLAPEVSIAYFFEAIVLRVSGDETGARAKVRQSLDHGFPSALMAADPDLNPKPTCPLTERMPLPPETCRISR